MKPEVQRLKTELVIRTSANPKYSLRAFARDLRISPSLLCEVFKGRRNFSSATFEKIQIKLGWTSQRKTTIVKSEQIQSLTWLHLAILELADLPPQRNDAKNIGTILGIPPKTVSYAIETLLTKGMLEIHEGLLVRKPQRYFFGSDIPSPLIRKYHKEFMQLAQARMESTNYDERELSSSMLALTHTQVQELRKRIRGVVEEFCHFSRINDRDKKIDKDKDKEIYGFSIQLFKISKKGEHK